MSAIKLNLNFGLIIFVVFLFLFSNSTTRSQTSIAQSEIMQIFTPGNLLYVIEGESGLINIGKYNGPNVYDFTQVEIQNPFTFQNFSVSQLPLLAGRFPANGTTMGEGPQNIVENPIFLWNTDSTFFLGEVIIESEYRFTHYIPYELFAKYPIEFNPPSSSFTQWITVYDTTFNLNWHVQSTDQYNTIVDVWIDGYGILKLPGLELECLRMKRAYSWFQFKDFFYLTKEGIMLVVQDVSDTAPDTGFVFGDFAILSTDPIVSVKDEQLSPYSFKLDQNYPNPFNPGTTISWQSYVAGHHSIKLFDVLGREIETIVEGYFDAGLHSTLYIAHSTLPSGVYFYQLKAGEFIQTKKMVLLK